MQCIALCAVLAAGSVIGASAAEIKQHKGVTILDSAINVPDNKLAVYAYNIQENNPYSVKYNGAVSYDGYSVKFADCISSEQTVSMPSGEDYTRSLISNRNGSGNINLKYSFENTGGEYVKVRFNLSAIDPGYFNTNGTHTNTCGNDMKHNYNFTEEIVSTTEYYSSCLFFQSGGVVTAVTPDSEGCVEIYMSTNIGDQTEYATGFSYGRIGVTGSGGGITGETVNALSFGNFDFDYIVDINDATILQLYLAGELNFDSLQYFYADINRDGQRDVRDVTAFQRAITGKF